jgi:HEAT repeat protein
MVLMVATGLFLVGTLALSAYALTQRALHMRRERELAALSERWLEPVLGAIGDPSLLSTVQGLVEEDDAIRFLDFVIEFARRVRGGERDILRELARPFLPRVLERLDARGTEMRAWGIQVLGTLGLPQYEEQVVAALDDPSQLVAMISARALAREETPQYAPSVLARLDRFGDWNKMFLASMLASMGPEVAEQLRVGLADRSGAPGTRAVMAEALHLQRDFAAGDVAAEVVRLERHTDLLAASLRLLAAVGRPEHASVVRPLCTSDDPVVRAQALRAMGPLADAEDLPTLLGAMDSEDPWPALYAARGARDAGGQEILGRIRGSGDRKAVLADQVLSEEAAL